jgi:hypothetical protein
MMKKPGRGEDCEFFNLPMARWVVGVLAMLIAVVGKESLLGLILRQTRSEILSIVRDEEQPVYRRPSNKWFTAN